MNFIQQIKNYTFGFTYFFYTLFPIYLLINLIRYRRKKFALRSYIFSKQIGQHVRIMGGVYIDKLSSVDDYSYISGNNFGLNITKIQNTQIGKFCSIGPNFITLPDEHDSKRLSTYPFPTTESNVISKPICIKNDVWIGSNVILLGGITIDDGCVIAAGSVVTTDIPAYSIVAGNPGKIIKKRFDDRTIKKLASIQWWENSKAWDVAMKFSNSVTMLESTKP